MDGKGKQTAKQALAKQARKEKRKIARKASRELAKIQGAAVPRGRAARKNRAGNVMPLPRAMRDLGKITAEAIIARFSAIPAEYKDRQVLYSGPFAARAVVPRVISTIFDAGWAKATAANTGYQFAASDYMLIVFRDARRAAINYSANTSNAEFGYELEAGIGLPSFPMNIEEYLDIIGATTTDVSAYNPHGPYLVANEYNGTPVIWIDATADHETMMSITGLSASKQYVFEQLLIQAGDRSTTQITVTSDASGNANFSLPSSGYYNWKLLSTTATSVATTHWTFTGNCGCMGHLTANSLLPLLGVAKEMRVTAVSVQYHNTAAPINRQGKIAAAQYPGSVPWDSLIPGGGASSYADVASSQDAYTGDLANGEYSFLRPTETDDYNLQTVSQLFTQASVFAEGSAYPTRLPCYSKGDYLVIYAVCTSADGQDAEIELTQAFEYTTQNPWLPSIKPKATPEVFMKGVSLLAEIQQHHENPLHLKDISAFVKRWAGRVSRAAGMASVVPGPQSPFLSGASVLSGALESVL